MRWEEKKYFKFNPFLKVLHSTKKCCVPLQNLCISQKKTLHSLVKNSKLLGSTEKLTAHSQEFCVSLRNLHFLKKNSKMLFLFKIFISQTWERKQSIENIIFSHISVFLSLLFISIICPLRAHRLQ